MNKEEVEKVLEELNQVDPLHLNDKALRLFNAIMSIADERDLYKNRIDKAIKYITSEEYFFLNNLKTGSFVEDSNNYMKAHNKLLEILEGKEI